MTTTNSLKTILEDLLNRNSDVMSALVATVDGISLADAKMQNISGRLAAMASASLGLGRQLIATVCSGTMKEIKVSGDKGQVFIYSITNKAVLVVVTKEEPNVAMVNWEAQKTVKHLTELI